MTLDLACSDIGRLSADALATMATRSIAGRPLIDYACTSALAWSDIADGGWDLIGAPESDGGGGARLRDLVEVARVCGALALPTPLLESLWVKRWSAAARKQRGPVSVAVPARGAPGSGAAPHGAEPGVLVARSVGRADDEFVAAAGAVDDFAPTLRLVSLPWVTSVSGEAVSDLVTLWTAEAVGAAQRLVDLSVDYARNRQQFGRPVGSFQAVKHQLADMHSWAEYADTAVVWASAEPEETFRACGYALETAIRVAQGAIQVHGGMGFTWELGLHIYLRAMLSRRDLVQGLAAAR